MKKFLLKILGLADIEANLCILVMDTARLEKAVADLTMAQEGQTATVAELTETVSEMETPDMDDYILSSDLDDNIESYLNNNDYATVSYVDDEVESKVEDAVDDKIETAIDDLDITAKVEEIVARMDKASFGDTEELKAIVMETLKSVKFKIE
jgi:hypothetical protein